MHEIQASPQERREDEDVLSWGGRRENRGVINLWGFIPGKGDFFSECCWVRRRGELNKATCFAGRGGKRGTWEREKKKKRKLEFKRSNYDSSLMHICTGVFMQLYAFLPKSPHKKVQKSWESEIHSYAIIPPTGARKKKKKKRTNGPSFFFRLSEPWRAPHPPPQESSKVPS